MSTPIATLAGTTRRPRIGVDFHFFGTPFPGRLQHLVPLYREAVRRAPEFDFVFFCAEPDKLRIVDPAFGAPNVQCLPLPAKGDVARLGWQLALRQWANKIDLLHVQDAVPLLPIAPCAVTIHETSFRSHPASLPKGAARRAHAAAWLALRRASLLFAPSDAATREIARLYGVDPARIVVTGNGVNLARFHPVSADGSDEWNGAALVRGLGAEPGEYLLAVGRDEPLKNRLGLVRAYALLAEPRPPLLVVGRRDPAKETAKDAPAAEAAALGVQDGITFIERVGDDELAALMRHARVVVHPSLAEAFGMPVLEAMASGVAVVTSDVPALVELGAGATQMAAADDPQAIAGAIERLLYDNALRRRLAAAGLEVAAKHRWDAAAKAMLAAYRRFFAAHPLK